MMFKNGLQMYVSISNPMFQVENDRYVSILISNPISNPMFQVENDRFNPHLIAFNIK